MDAFEQALAGHREAVNRLISTADTAAGIWTTPRSPGKWSPSQVTEHVARALEESANVAAGRPSKFPTFPAFVRPLVRVLFFNRVLKNKGFPKAKTNKPFDPEAGPSSPEAARTRLLEAAAQFEEGCKSCHRSGGIVDSTIFGHVPVEAYITFQELHTRHHTDQIPPA